MIASAFHIACCGWSSHRLLRLALVVTLLGGTAPALAQRRPEPAAEEKKPKPANWKELSVPDPPGGQAAASGQARLMLRNDQITDQNLFDAYWRWFFAQLTKWENHESLDDLRLNVRAQLRTRRGAAQRRLVQDIALPMTTQIAADAEYAPIVRVNALLILGDLNRTEPDAQGRGAVALPEAVRPLLQHLDPRREADGGVNDALRAAALVGLENHAERGGIQDAQMRGVAVRMLQQIVQQQTPPQRPSEVHEFLQKRAQEVLNKLAGGDAAVAGRPRAAARPEN